MHDGLRDSVGMGEELKNCRGEKDEEEMVFHSRVKPGTLQVFYI